MNEYMIQALAIIDEWNAKTGAEQQVFCRNCVLKGIREGRKLAHGDELDDAVNSTFIRVLEQLADADELARNIEKRADKGLNDSLPAIVSRAAKAFLQREINRTERDSVIVDNITTTTDGQQYSILDTIAAKDDTEKVATIRATLRDFYNGLDATNQIIFRGMAQGKYLCAFARRGS